MAIAAEPLRHEVRIDAPPEVVFPYFTDPARMVEWMGVAALLDPRPGGALRIEVNGRDVVLGEFVEVEPPRRVVFTWGFDGSEPLVAAGSTRVEVTLEPDGEGTLVTLRHHGLHGAAARDAHAEGWTHFLARLARAAATGQHIKSAVLTFRRSNDTDIEFLTYTLSDVQVTSYDQGGRDGDERDLGSLEEEVGFTAARIHVSEQTVTENGDKGPVVTADWTVPRQAAAPARTGTK